MAKDGTRVVITGLGVMSPLGETVDEFWGGLSAGRSGIGKITQCDTDGFPGDIAGEVTGFDAGQYANPKETRRMARFAQFACRWPSDQALVLVATSTRTSGKGWGQCERRGLVRNDPIGGLPRLGCQTVPQGPGYPCELAFVRPASHPAVSRYARAWKSLETLEVLISSKTVTLRPSR